MSITRVHTLTEILDLFRSHRSINCQFVRLMLSNTVFYSSISTAKMTCAVIIMYIWHLLVLCANFSVKSLKLYPNWSLAYFQPISAVTCYHSNGSSQINTRVILLFFILNITIRGKLVNKRNTRLLFRLIWARNSRLMHVGNLFYQSPIVLTELFQHNLINVSYLTACYIYQVMMKLHFLNDVANDAESTQNLK